MLTKASSSPDLLHRCFCRPQIWRECHSPSRCPFPTRLSLSPTPTYFQRLSLFVFPLPLRSVLMRTFIPTEVCVRGPNEDVETTSWAHALPPDLPPLLPPSACLRALLSLNRCLPVHLTGGIVELSPNRHLWQRLSRHTLECRLPPSSHLGP